MFNNFRHQSVYSLYCAHNNHNDSIYFFFIQSPKNKLDQLYRELLFLIRWNGNYCSDSPVQLRQRRISREKRYLSEIDNC